MADLRLAVVTPRCWPLIDDRSLHIIRLGEALAEAGCEVSVVTPRWTRAWPEQIALGPVAVRRLPGSAAGGLGTLRWTYSLGRWLRSAPADAVLVSGLKREAMIALTGAGQGDFLRIVLAGDDDPAWHTTAAGGGRVVERCSRADAVVAFSEQLASRLIEAGCDPNRLTVIPRGAVPPPARTADTRAAARLALAAVNYDLATASNSLVALAVGRLDEQHQFGDLIRAWRIVTARRPEAKLWIVGDGPYRQRLYQQIGDLDQRFRIMLPGTFERYDELLAACDMLLVPGTPDVPPLAVLDAMAAGIPVVMAASPTAQQMAQSYQPGLSYPPGDDRALAECVFRTIEQPDGALKPPLDQLPRSPADEAADYVALIERLQSKICNRKSAI